MAVFAQKKLNKINVFHFVFFFRFFFFSTNKKTYLLILRNVFLLFFSNLFLDCGLNTQPPVLVVSALPLHNQSEVVHEILKKYLLHLIQFLKHCKQHPPWSHAPFLNTLDAVTSQPALLTHVGCVSNV